MKMAQKRLRNSAFNLKFKRISAFNLKFKRNDGGISHTFAFFLRKWHRNYSELCFFLGGGIDSEITQNFAYFEKMVQRHGGIDLKIAQNSAIFEKMAKEKLRLHR